MLNSHLLTADKPLKVKLTGADEHSACLELSDKQRFEVNKKFLPSGVKIGEVLYLSLVDEKQLNLERDKVAKEVLDEILN